MRKVFSRSEELCLYKFLRHNVLQICGRKTRSAKVDPWCDLPETQKVHAVVPTTYYADALDCGCFKVCKKMYHYVYSLQKTQKQ